MATQAEQMAAGLTMSNFAQATDLQKRIWFTLGALIIFRLLSYVPLPGIDPIAMADVFQRNQGGVLDLFNSFSGGALQRMSIIAVGVMPYITASIVVQLSTSLSPSMNTLKKEGESGRKKLNQYTRYLTVLLTAIYGFSVASALLASHTATGQSVAYQGGILFYISTITALVGGTMFLMWLGEQITSRGIGNGISLIIMAGIVSQLPGTLGTMFESVRTGSGQYSALSVIFISILAIVLIAFICFMEQAQRRLLIQYPKRQTMRGVQQEKSFLPLKINTANVIPPIFASSLLAFPITLLGWFGKSATGENKASDIILTIVNLMQPGAWLHALLYALLIIFFCFFYSAITFNPEETADNLKRHGGFIPGIRPGKNTADYLDYVLVRITVIGAAYLTLICLVPEILLGEGYSSLRRLGGTGLLIVVNVTIDTVTQIQG
ncbi:MAG: preprotein translocase subunit SecY, partial [Alphaproteobacteria bacterium]|nr:preprotein translocase subunit SecY [Alphaproteobacteria bacterium]